MKVCFFALPTLRVILACYSGLFLFTSSQVFEAHQHNDRWIILLPTKLLILGRYFNRFVCVNGVIQWCTHQHRDGTTTPPGQIWTTRERKGNTNKTPTLRTSVIVMQDYGGAASQHEELWKTLTSPELRCHQRWKQITPLSRPLITHTHTPCKC